MSTIAPPFKIVKKAAVQPPRIVIYGVEGIGKTALGAQFDRPFFLMSPRETGLLTLQASGQVGEVDHFQPITTWYDLVQAISWLACGEHDNKTLVIDTINGVERDLYFKWIIDSQFEGKIEKFTGYAKDKKYPHELWKTFLDGLDACQARGMAIVLLGHATISRLNDPDGKDYDRYIPRFANQTTWDITFAWADMVLFANHVVATVEDGNKIKGRSTGIRNLYAERRPAFDAKNRYKLPPTIDMGGSAKEAYANLMTAFAEARKRNTENQ